METVTPPTNTGDDPAAGAAGSVASQDQLICGGCTGFIVIQSSDLADFLSGQALICVLALATMAIWALARFAGVLP